MSHERHLGHKLAIGLGVLVLVALWYQLLGVEDELTYKLEQASALSAGAVAFGVALLYARGQRQGFPLGWAYVGAIATTGALYASLMVVFGGAPTGEGVAYSLGLGLGLNLPYLLVAYGWKGAEINEPENG